MVSKDDGRNKQVLDNRSNGHTEGRTRYESKQRAHLALQRSQEQGISEPGVGGTIISCKCKMYAESRTEFKQNN